MTERIPDSHHVLEFPYTRTTGPVVGPFLTALRDGKILGSRIDGKVHCPPLEFHPTTAAAVESDFVEIGPGGTVQSWTWVAHPTPKHPLSEPFAFALIHLDGADTPIAHAVKAGSADEIATGMRVCAQWREERAGAITDVYFVPRSRCRRARDRTGRRRCDHHGASDLAHHRRAASSTSPSVRRRLAGRQDHRPAQSGVGQSLCARPRLRPDGADSHGRVNRLKKWQMRAPWWASPKSTPCSITGRKSAKPYIRCSILLDGTDQPVQGIDVRHIGVEDFRVGMRMKAVWKAAEDRYLEDIDNRYGSIPETVVERWDPTGEPDVDPSQLKEHAM